MNPIDNNLDKFEEENIFQAPIDRNQKFKHPADKVLSTGEYFGGLTFEG